MGIFSGHSHSFDVGIAKELGINAAVIFNHIVYWLRVNAAKGHDIREGKVWMYERQQDMADFFEYLSLDDVKKAMVKLIDSGLLIKGNFNPNPFDKTGWYTTADQNIIHVKKSSTKVPNGTIGGAKRHDPGCHLAPCIIQEDKQQDNTVCIDSPVGRQKVDSLNQDPSNSDSPRWVTKISTAGKEIVVNRDEIISGSMFSKKDWRLTEINEAWDILCEYKGAVNDGFAFIEGTIRNLRNGIRANHANKTETKKDIKCGKKHLNNDSQELKEKLLKNKDSSSEKDSMGSPFLPLKEMLAKKYHAGWKPHGAS